MCYNITITRKGTHTMARIEHYDKRVGITYVYESESYYDREKQQSRSRRKLIGKIDPETGEMIPTGKRGRPSKNITPNNETVDYKRLSLSLQKQLEKSEDKIKTMEADLKKAKDTINGYQKTIRKISALCDGEIG